MVWYENEVQRLEKERAALTYDPKLLFYGSIRYTNKIIEEEINRQANNLHFINIYNRMTDNAGEPVLFFPTRTARFYDYEDWKVIDALRKKIESGEIQVYCLASVDRESFYCRDIHPAERIIRYLQYAGSLHS